MQVGYKGRACSVQRTSHSTECPTQAEVATCVARTIQVAKVYQGCCTRPVNVLCAHTCTHHIRKEQVRRRCIPHDTTPSFAVGAGIVFPAGPSKHPLVVMCVAPNLWPGLCRYVWGVRARAHMTCMVGNVNWISRKSHLVVVVWYGRSRWRIAGRRSVQVRLWMGTMPVGRHCGQAYTRQHNHTCSCSSKAEHSKLHAACRALTFISTAWRVSHRLGRLIIVRVEHCST